MRFAAVTLFVLFVLVEAKKEYRLGSKEHKKEIVDFIQRVWFPVPGKKKSGLKTHCSSKIAQIDNFVMDANPNTEWHNLTLTLIAHPENDDEGEWCEDWKKKYQCNIFVIKNRLKKPKKDRYRENYMSQASTIED